MKEAPAKKSQPEPLPPKRMIGKEEFTSSEIR